MDPVLETPLKRRKVSTGYVRQGFDSEDDSGDEIFRDYETVDTVPLPLQNPLHSDSLLRTQNGDFAGQSHNDTAFELEIDSNPPQIQVNASSPLSKPSRKPQNLLTKSIAPAGTFFRPPARAIETPVARHSADEEEDDILPQYQGDSSENEHPRRSGDIKPAVFTSERTTDVSSTQISGRFQSITANARYDPAGSRPTGTSVSQDGVAQAQRPTQTQHQSLIPEPSIDIPIEAIADLRMRKRIRDMLAIMPEKSVLACRDALLRKKHNFDDACNYLLEKADVIDLTGPHEDGTKSSIGAKQTAKQQLRDPVQKIHDKWASKKTLAKPSSPPPLLETKATPPPKLRRLVQGRRKTSPSEVEIVGARLRSSDADTDSGFDESSQSEGEEDLEILNFFNNAQVPDLIDTASTSRPTAELIVAQRPFASLEEVRQVQETQGQRRLQRMRVGERILSKVSEMFQGYRAIDVLIERCNENARPMAESISKWGIDIGESTGEIEIVDLDIAKQHCRDSGIGTPSSRSTSIERDTGQDPTGVGLVRRGVLHKQPASMGDGIILKDYQIVGLNWLFLLYQHRLSGILADDMGLGKTCQIIGFLALLSEQGTKGPHLIIVPSSTLENWLREFSVFCPEFNVVPYYASQQERAEIRAQVLDERNAIDVVLTTYAVAKMKDDNKFLRKLRPVCCIYDEGHVLKNSKSAGYEMYTRITAECRILLTGTPLQNNLVELCSLLRFILPEVFKDHVDDLNIIFGHKARTNDDESSHATLLSAQRVSRAKSIMTPFILRRKKHQVLKHLPIKTKRLQRCRLTESQSDIYEREKTRALHVLADRKEGKAKGKESTNVMMGLRKASIHPLLFRRIFNDGKLRKMCKACLSEEQFRESNPELVFEDMSVMDDIELHRFSEQYSSLSRFALRGHEWMDSGKVEVLTGLLTQYKAAGDRVLIFSQFVQVINILEYVMETLQVQFFRLDGSTKVEERQAMIDTFSKDTAITVFLLSTKAGGAGINLACANKVIIFDSSFNPQDDIQAENRAHRVGQTREVEVVRLITQDTIEEQIHALGATKLALDERVAGLADDSAAQGTEKQGIQRVEKMVTAELLGDGGQKESLE